MSLRRTVPPTFVLALALGAAPASAGPARSEPAPPPPAQMAPPPGVDTATPPASSSPRAPPSKTPGAPPPPGTTSAGTTPGGERAADAPAVDDEPVDLSRTWSYSRRRAAPEPRFVRKPDEKAAPHPSGFYSGVSLSGNHVPPSAPEKVGAKPVLLTWTGFERTDAGTQVYFQVSADVDFVVSESPGRVVIRLRNTRVNVRNNARSLDLRFFDTPARMVKVRKRGRDLEATIELKRRTTPRIEQVADPTGYRMVVVRFDDEATPEARERPPVRR